MLRTYHLILVSTLFFLSLGCYPQQIVSDHQATPRNVTVVEVREEVSQPSVALIGRIEPWREATIYFEVSGVIEEFYVEEGAKMQPGDPIARLNCTDFELTVAKAQAELEAAQAQFDLLLAGTRKEDLEAAQADHARTIARQEFWKAELARAENLFRKDKAVTVSELERTQHEYESSVQERRFAKARLDRAIAGPRNEDKETAGAEANARQQAVALAKRQLAKATIRAPFESLVEKRFVDAGAYINVFPTGGVPAIQLVDLRQVDVVVSVPETMIRELADIENVEVASAVTPELTATARVITVGKIADKSSGTYELRARMDNPQGRFVGGMVITAEIRTGQSRPSVRVPITSVRHAYGQASYVLVVSPESSSVQSHEIDLGPVHGDWVEINDGLVGGELLIVRGQHFVVPGDEVTYQHSESISQLSQPSIEP